MPYRCWCGPYSTRRTAERKAKELFRGAPTEAVSIVYEAGLTNAARVDFEHRAVDDAAGWRERPESPPPSRDARSVSHTNWLVGKSCQSLAPARQSV